MVYENISSDLHEGILHLIIQRETKLNALNIALLREIDHALAQHQTNPTLKGVILTGAGAKAFAAGADIAEFAHFSIAEGKHLAAQGHAIFKRIELYPKPVIAAVNGFALGGGCELAMACHLRIATPNAKFGQPEVNLGIIPGYGGTQRLAQLIGKGKALELLMTADLINADEALRLGLVNHIVATTGDLLPKCTEIIKKIATKAPLAIAKVIEAVDAGYTDGMDGFDTEITLFAACFATQDFKEGTTAFVEKRPAQFIGE